MNASLSALRAFWARLATRDRRAVGLALTVLGLFLLWRVGVVPAWHTLQTTPALRSQAQAQLQDMQAWAAQAQALRSAPPSTTSRPETLAALAQATRQTLGDRATLITPAAGATQATVTLQGAHANALAQWLDQVRANAHLRPARVQLTRVPAPDGERLQGSVTLGGEGLDRP